MFKKGFHSANRTIRYYLLMPKGQLFARGLTYFLAINFLIPPQMTFAADIQVDPVQAETKFEKTSGGTDLIQLSKPSTGGVSKNQFNKYNVDEKGILLNNGTAQNKSILTGEQVAANRNFAGKSADIVLFEVTKANTSQLKGTTEVVGKSADFILANPWGIQVNGAGFINAPRVTLTTGVVKMVGGSIGTIDINDGKIEVLGKGLSGSGSQYVDILSRALVIQGSLSSGGLLNVVGGRNQVNYLTGEVTAITSSTSQKAPALSIDGSELGAMLAGRISIVSTEKGVGVNTQGMMTALLDDIMISSDGNVSYKQAVAAGNLGVRSAAGSIYQGQGMSAAGANIALMAKKDIEMKGDVVAQDTVMAVSEDGLLTIGNVTPKTGAALSTYVQSKEIALVSAKGTVIQNATLVADNKMSVQSKGSIQALSSDMMADTISVKTQETFTQDNTYLETYNGDILIQSKHLNSKDSSLFSGQDVVILANGDVVQKNSVIDGVSVALQATSLKNFEGSAILAVDNGVVRVTGKLDNDQSSMIDSMGHLVVQGQDMVNAGWVGGLGNLVLEGKSLVNSGQIDGVDQLSIQVTDGILNDINGIVRSDGTVQVIGTIFENKGQIASDQSDVNIRSGSGGLKNSGQIAAVERLSLNGTGVVTNQGILTSLSTLSVFGGQDLVNDGGMIVGNKSVYLGSDLGSVKNQKSGTVLSNGQLVVLAQKEILNTDSDMTGNGIVLQAELIKNWANQSKSQLGSTGESLLLTATRVENTGKNAVISGLSDVLSQSQTLVNSGQFKAIDHLILNGITLDTKLGELAGGTIRLTSGGDYELGGKMTAENQVEILAKKIINSTDFITNSRLELKSDTDIRNTAILTVNNDFILDAKGSVVNQNTLNTGGALFVTAGLDFIHEGGTVTVKDMADFNVGQDLIVRGADLKIEGSTFVDAKRDFRIDAKLSDRSVYSENSDFRVRKSGTDVYGATAEFGDDVFITTGQDFKLLGSKADFKGKAWIETGRDFFLESGMSWDSQNKDQKGSRNDFSDETTDAIGSILTIAEDAWISTKRDLVLEGSELKIEGNAVLASGADIGLFSAEEMKFTDYRTNNGQNKKVSTTITNQSSKLTLNGDYNQISAKQDITLEGSTLDASGQTHIEAGGDINVIAAVNSSEVSTSKTKRELFQKKKKTTTVQKKENVASQLNLGDESAVIANGNLNIVGSKIDVDGDGLLYAKKDVNILSAEDTYSSVTKKSNTGITNSKSSVSVNDSTQVASNVTMAGNLSIVSEGNTLINGSSLKAGEELMVDAKGSLGITSAEESKKTVSKSQSNQIVSYKESKEVTMEMTQKKSSLEAEGDIILKSGSDILVSGSDILSKGNINMQANGKVTVASAAETSYKYLFEKSAQLTGFKNTSDRSSISSDLSFSGKETESESLVLSQLGALVLAGGDLNILSGEDTLVLGSTLSSGGNMNLFGQNIKVLTTEEVSQVMNRSAEFKQTVSMKIGNAWVETAYQAKDAAGAVNNASKPQTSGKSDPNSSEDAKRNEDINTTAKVLQATLAAAQVAKAVQSVGSSADSAQFFGFYGSLTGTTSYDESKSESNSVTGKGSSLSSGGNLSLSAKNQLEINGSSLNSKNGNLSLSGKDISVTAGKGSMSESNSQNKYSVAVTMASSSVSQVAVQLPTLSYDKNKVTNAQAVNLMSNISAENGSVIMTADGGNLSLEGVSVLGKNIEMSALKGKITVKSLQDTVSYKQNGEGLSLGNTMGFRVSEAEKQGKWVNGQTTIIGTDSVDIRAKTLQNDGALIANATKDGVDKGNLTIVADQILFSTLKDSYKEYSYNIGLGMNVNGSYDAKAGTAGADPSRGSTSIQLSNSGVNQKQDTNATIGNGTIVTQSDISKLNRDIKLSQVMTKNQKTGGLSIDLTIDNEAITNPGAYFKPLTLLPENLEKAKNNVYAEGKIRYEKVWDGVTGRKWEADNRAYRDAVIRGNPYDPKVDQLRSNLSVAMKLHPDQFVSAVPLVIGGYLLGQALIDSTAIMIGGYLFTETATDAYDGAYFSKTYKPGDVVDLDKFTKKDKHKLGENPKTKEYIDKNKGQSHGDNTAKLKNRDRKRVATIDLKTGKVLRE